ncbi:MAG: thiolase family protein, partial [Methanomicrobiaceae archaeon]|nr:thiolase family protein [Methanomicrobiaceae archaeon]
MSELRGKIAVVGIGEVPTGRYPDTGTIFHAIESAKQAIRDAGIDKEEIDYVMPTASLYSPAFNTELVTCRVVEELGLKNVSKNCQVFAGGSSSTCAFQLAGSLINSKAATTVLFVHAERLGTGVDLQAGIDLFATSGISAEWEVPFGQHYSAVAAMSTTRYKYETGTTDEQLASVCVSNRKWAELNPNAFFRKPLTIEEVLSSKMLSTPLRAKMSNMLFDGGAAFIVTSAERARDITDRPVYLLGEGGIVTHFVFSQEPDVSRFGWAKAGRKAFAEAGLTPKDIDVAEIYDSYPIYQIIGFEELGFCERGQAGEMFLRGDTWPGGKIPVTTNGGMLSQGHTGAGGAVALL